MQGPAAAAPAPAAKLPKPAAAADVSGAKGAASATAASPAQQQRKPAAKAVTPAKPSKGGAKAAPKKKADGAGAAAAAAPLLGPAAVGKAVNVYWADDDAWYIGDITGVCVCACRGLTPPAAPAAHATEYLPSLMRSTAGGCVRHPGLACACHSRCCC